MIVSKFWRIPASTCFMLVASSCVLTTELVLVTHISVLPAERLLYQGLSFLWTTVISESDRDSEETNRPTDTTEVLQSGWRDQRYAHTADLTSSKPWKIFPISYKDNWNDHLLQASLGLADWKYYRSHTILESYNPTILQSYNPTATQNSFGIPPLWGWIMSGLIHFSCVFPFFVQLQLENILQITQFLSSLKWHDFRWKKTLQNWYHFWVTWGRAIYDLLIVLLSNTCCTTFLT